GGDHNQFRAVEGEGTRRFGKRQVPAEQDAEIAKISLKDRKFETGAERHFFFALQVYLAVFARDLAIGSDENTAVVNDALDLVLDDHPRHNPGMKIAGKF